MGVQKADCDHGRHRVVTRQWTTVTSASGSPRPTAVNQRAGISARYLTLGDAKRQVDFCRAAENARLG